MSLNSLDVQTQFLDLIQPSSFELEMESSIQQRRVSLGSFDVESESQNVAIQSENGDVSTEFNFMRETVTAPISSTTVESRSLTTSIGEGEMSYEVTTSQTETSAPIRATSSLMEWNQSTFSSGVGIELHSEIELQQSSSFSSVETQEQRISFAAAGLGAPVSVDWSSQSWSTEIDGLGQTAISSQSVTSNSSTSGATSFSQVSQEWSFEMPMSGATVNYSATQTEWNLPGPTTTNTIMSSTISTSSMATSSELSIQQAFTDISFGATPSPMSISFERTESSSEFGFELETAVTQSDWSQSLLQETSSSRFEFSLGGATEIQQSMSFSRQEISLNMTPALQLETSTTSLNLVDEPTMAVCRFDQVENVSNSLELNVAVTPDYSFDLVQQSSTVNFGLGIN